MKLIKGNRELTWIPLDRDIRSQVKKGKRGNKFGLMEFEGTKEEKEVAARCGRPTPRHHAWVNLSSMTESST